MKLPSLNDILHYTEGNFNYLTRTSLPKYIKEQILVRQALCSSCLMNGKCKHCGCKTPHMFYSTTKVDSENKWGPFLSKIQWEALKNNIDGYYRAIKDLSSLPNQGEESIQSEGAGHETLPLM